jgi:hypothetical protein
MEMRMTCIYHSNHWQAEGSWAGTIVNGSDLFIFRPQRIMKRFLVPYRHFAGMSEMFTVYHRDDASHHLRSQWQCYYVHYVKSADMSMRFECAVRDEVRCAVRRLR